ncbi:MAG: hypothetical protein AABW79_01620 [Nanoarchaeota archaeon]
MTETLADYLSTIEGLKVKAKDISDEFDILRVVNKAKKREGLPQSPRDSFMTQEDMTISANNSFILGLLKDHVTNYMNSIGYDKAQDDEDSKDNEIWYIPKDARDRARFITILETSENTKDLCLVEYLGKYAPK